MIQETICTMELDSGNKLSIISNPKGLFLQYRVEFDFDLQPIIYSRSIIDGRIDWLDEETKISSFSDSIQEAANQLCARTMQLRAFL